MGHPYVDVIDNSTDFNNKVRRAIDVRMETKFIYIIITCDQHLLLAINKN